MKIHKYNLESKRPEGRTVSSFVDLARLGVDHFQNLYKADERISIGQIVRIAGFFPSFVDEEANRSMFEEVSEEELKMVLHNFQKDKSLGPDGWTVEFFLGLYEVIGQDI
jgi:hypothetical protein